MRDAAADDVGKTENPHLFEESFHRGSDAAFRGKLHGSVIRDRKQRAGVFAQGAVVRAINRRTGREGQTRDAERVHRLERVERGEKSQAQIHIRVVDTGGNVRVGRHMPDFVNRRLPTEERDRGVQVVHVEFAENEAGIFQRIGEVFASAKDEIVRAEDAVAPR